MRRNAMIGEDRGQIGHKPVLAESGKNGNATQKPERRTGESAPHSDTRGNGLVLSFRGGTVANKQCGEWQSQQCDPTQQEVCTAPAVMSDRPLCGGRYQNRANTASCQDQRQCEAAVFLEPGENRACVCK